MRVLLLAGGYSNERDVSMRSGDAVEAGLKARGHTVNRVDPKEDLDWVAIIKETDVAFIALHGAGGEDGDMQAQLEALGIPYIGSGVGASDLCWDKWAYKEFLSDKDIPLSEGIIVSANDTDHEFFKKPYVLKPIRGGSSLDTVIAHQSTSENQAEATRLLTKYQFMLLEPLIAGIEITVPVVGSEALDVIEIVPPEDHDFDYIYKYNGETQELCPPLHISEETQKEARDIALKIHNLTGCRDLSRTDMMVDHDGKLHVLETNTIPGLTNTSLLPKAAAVSGMEMSELCDLLVQLAAKH